MGCNWKYVSWKSFFSPSSGKVQVKLSDEKGGLVPIQVLDNEDGTYSVDYVAPSEGNYKVNANLSFHEPICFAVLFRKSYLLCVSVLFATSDEECC